MPPVVPTKVLIPIIIVTKKNRVQPADMQTVTDSPFALPVRDYSPAMRTPRIFLFTAFYRCHATPRVAGLWSMTKLLLMAQLRSLAVIRLLLAGGPSVSRFRAIYGMVIVHPVDHLT